MLSKFAVTTILSGAIVTAGLLFAGSASAQTEVLINNYLPPKHPFQTQIVAPWIDEVIVATGGSVTPTLSAAAVGPPPKNWQTVVKGVADVVVLANLFQPKRIQLPTVAEIPLNSGSSEKTSAALWSTHEKFFAAANEYDGAVLLGSFSLTPNVIHSGTGPIVGLADLKGYKLRASPGVATNVLKELGAVPVASGPSKIFGLISKGVVDGVAVPAHGLPAFRMQPYIKAVTTFPGGMSNTTFSLLMNKDKWDSLSAEQQAQVMSVSGAHVSSKGPGMDRIANGALKTLQETGGQVVEADAAVLAVIRKFADKMEADWVTMANAKGVDGPAALAFFRDQLK